MALADVDVLNSIWLKFKFSVCDFSVHLVILYVQNVRKYMFMLYAPTYSYVLFKNKFTYLVNIYKMVLLLRELLCWPLKPKNYLYFVRNFMAFFDVFEFKKHVLPNYHAMRKNELVEVKERVEKYPEIHFLFFCIRLKFLEILVQNYKNLHFPF